MFKGVVRLANGIDYGEGNVLIYDDARDKWMEVCADNWDLQKTDIVCKQVGFLGGYKGTKFLIIITSVIASY